MAFESEDPDSSENLDQTVPRRFQLLIELYRRRYLYQERFAPIALVLGGLSTLVSLGLFFLALHPDLVVDEAIFHTAWAIVFAGMVVFVILIAFSKCEPRKPKSHGHV